MALVRRKQTSIAQQRFIWDKGVYLWHFCSWSILSYMLRLWCCIHNYIYRNLYTHRNWCQSTCQCVPCLPFNALKHGLWYKKTIQFIKIKKAQTLSSSKCTSTHLKIFFRPANPFIAFLLIFRWTLSTIKNQCRHLWQEK